MKDGTSEKSPQTVDQTSRFHPGENTHSRTIEQVNQKGGNVIRCNTEPNLSSDKCQSNLDLPLDFHRTNEIYVYTYL